MALLRARTATHDDLVYGLHSKRGNVNQCRHIIPEVVSDETDERRTISFERC